MAEETKKTKEIIQRTKEFRNIYAIGAFGGWTPYDFRMEVYSEILPGTEDAIMRMSDALIIMTPKATKELHLWLAKNIEEYEKKNGVIEIEEKKPSKDTKM